MWASHLFLSLCLVAGFIPGGWGAYVPGTPGGPWTREQFLQTRVRVLAMINQTEEAVTTLYSVKDPAWLDPTGIHENVLLRLAFHDCLRYKDGTGGCDGCLNWKGVGFKFDNFPARFKPLHYYRPTKKTDNNGLQSIVVVLERLYTSVDWPPTAPPVAVSLKDSGISRADLWAFAGLVALEEAIERANWACEYDFNARQQVTLLEGRDKCDIKLTKPIKFHYGRADCIPSNDERPYITRNKEAHPTKNDAKQIVDLMKHDFNMSARHFIALNGIHSVAAKIHKNTVGTKYVWFGSSYLSNMYFKEIANRPLYYKRGSDLTFIDAKPYDHTWEFHPYSYGDVEGKPIASRAWRLSCMNLWNTTDEGPCFFRATNTAYKDNPAWVQNGTKLVNPCGVGFDHQGNTFVLDRFWCKNAKFTKNGVQVGMYGFTPFLDPKKGTFNNEFAFPYEIGVYLDFEVRGRGLRPYGCPEIDMPTVDLPYYEALFNHGEHGTRNSDPLTCKKTSYAPEGEAMSAIVEDFADNHDVWAEDFLDAWQIMQHNSDSKLEVADQASWLGYHSLTKANVDVGDYEKYITRNVPLVFTSHDADPYICGHFGENSKVNKHDCGHKMSEYRDQFRQYIPDTIPGE